jgi:hypothetical protein
LYQLEYDMMTSRKSLLRKLCCGVSVAALLLALSFTASRPSRAEPEALTPLLEAMITPIITAVQGVEGRVARLENTVSSFADSFTSQRIATQQLCVSDESGAQTCITKSQLDALLMIESHSVSASIPSADASAASSAEAAKMSPTDSQPEQDADQKPASPFSQQAAVNVDDTNAAPTEAGKSESAKDAGSASSSGGDQQPEQTGSLSPSPSSTESDLAPEATPNGAL